MHEVFEPHIEQPNPGDEVIAALPQWRERCITAWLQELPTHTLEKSEKGILHYNHGKTDPKVGSEARTMTVVPEPRKFFVSQTRRNQFYTAPATSTDPDIIRQLLKGKQTYFSQDMVPASAARDPVPSLILTKFSLRLERWTRGFYKHTTQHWIGSDRSNVAVLNQQISFEPHYFTTKYALRLNSAQAENNNATLEDHLLFEIFANYDVKTLLLSQCKIEVVHFLAGERAKTVLLLHPQAQDILAGFIDAVYVQDEMYGALPSENTVPNVFEHKSGLLSAQANLVYPGLQASLPVDIQLQFTPQQILRLNDAHLDPKVTLTSTTGSESV